MPFFYSNRREAGQRLALHLLRYDLDDAVVLALPRGGVPVAYEVARALRAPLDVFVVRKLGVPGHEELAFGAIASRGVTVFNRDVIEDFEIPDSVIEAVAAREAVELARRERAYRGGRMPVPVAGRTVVLVDDGLATGASMRAAIQALCQLGPARIVVAVPVSAADTCEDLREEVELVICAETPEPFYGVGVWYEDFSQTTDEEVSELLIRAELARISASTEEARASRVY